MNAHDQVVAEGFGLTAGVGMAEMNHVKAIQVIIHVKYKADNIKI